MSAHARRCLLALALLVAAGVVRMPVEQAFTEDLRQRELLRRPVDLETRKKLGQGFWAVSLGGLRTLVATILNLRAHHFFEGQEWTRLAETYDTIVQLAPATRYYWDTGSWHMAYNAASHYLLDSDLPGLRKDLEWRRWILRGTEFLEEGVRQNPGDWRLWANLGVLYSDRNKLIDYAKAEEAFRRSLETGDAPPHIARSRAYALARVPGKEREALELVRALYAPDRRNVPTLTALRFALESRFEPRPDPVSFAIESFGDARRAYRGLGDYLLSDESYPMDGVRPALGALEERLDVPASQSILAPR